MRIEMWKYAFFFHIFICVCISTSKCMCMWISSPRQNSRNFKSSWEYIYATSNLCACISTSNICVRISTEKHVYVFIKWMAKQSQLQIHSEMYVYLSAIWQICVCISTSKHMCMNIYSKTYVYVYLKSMPKQWRRIQIACVVVEGLRLV